MLLSSQARNCERMNNAENNDIASKRLTSLDLYMVKSTELSFTQKYIPVKTRIARGTIGKKSATPMIITVMHSEKSEYANESIFDVRTIVECTIDGSGVLSQTRRRSHRQPGHE